MLFDIDGTLLLQASEQHATALREALAAVYGVEATATVPAAGRTDTAIARDLAALGGVEGPRFDAGVGALHGADGGAVREVRSGEPARPRCARDARAAGVARRAR